MLTAIQSMFLLAALFGILLLINYVVLVVEKQSNNKRTLMNRFMGSVFVLFGVLKLINIQQFVALFRKYDVISQQWIVYAFMYPFIEIGVGIGLLMGSGLQVLYIFVLVLMSVSLASVTRSIYTGEQLRCGCLGSLFNIPLSYVTVAENLLMLGMASYLIGSSPSKI